MKNTPQRPNRSALLRYGPPWRSPCAGADLHRLYRQVFDPPALSDEAEARRRAAKRYRSYLEARHGGNVPQNEIDDFEAGFPRGCARPDVSEVPRPERELSGSGEGYHAGFRAGQRYRQRQRANGRQREPQIPAYPNRDRPSVTLPASVLYTFERAAGELSVSEDTPQQFVHSGKLDTFEHGGRVWIHPKALVDYERRAERRGAGR